MRQYLSLAALMVCIGFISCTDNPTADPTPDPTTGKDTSTTGKDTSLPMLPLKVGNSWTYTRTENGTVKAEAVVSITRMKHMPFKFTARKSGVVDVYVLTPPPRPSVVFAEDGFAYDADTLMNGFFNNPTIYDTLVVNNQIPNRAAIEQAPWLPTYYVIDKKEDLTVPAGTFTGCWRQRYNTSSGLTVDRWFKPGIGMVKAVVVDTSPVSNETFELKSYTLK